MGMISAYGVLFFTSQRMPKYDTYRHTLTYVMVTSQRVQHKLNCAQVRTQYPYGHLWVYIQGVTGGTDQTSGGCSLC